MNDRSESPAEGGQPLPSPPADPPNADGPPDTTEDGDAVHGGGRRMPRPRDAAGSTARRGGRATQAAGKTLRATGRSGEVAGHTLQTSGRTAQSAGKGLKHGGAATAAGGKTTLSAGKALTATGYGAVVGVPLAAVGGATVGVGYAGKASGTAADVGGKGAHTAGTTTRRAGKATRQAGKKTDDAGRRAVDVGDHIQQGGQADRDGASGQLRRVNPVARTNDQLKRGDLLRRGIDAAGSRAHPAVGAAGQALYDKAVGTLRFVPPAYAAWRLAPLVLAIAGLALLGLVAGGSPTVVSVPAADLAGADDGEVEDATAADLSAGEVRSLVEDYKDESIDELVPWPIIFGLAEAASQHGHVDPYTLEDRDPHGAEPIKPAGGDPGGYGPLLLAPQVVDERHGDPHDPAEAARMAAGHLADWADDELDDRLASDGDDGEFSNDKLRDIREGGFHRAFFDDDELWKAHVDFWRQAVAESGVVELTGNEECVDSRRGLTVPQLISLEIRCAAVAAGTPVVVDDPLGGAEEPLTGSAAINQLIEEAVEVAWLYNEWGARVDCHPDTPTGGVFPVPPAPVPEPTDENPDPEPEYDRCDDVDNVAEAAERLVDRAATPIEERPAAAGTSPDDSDEWRYARAAWVWQAVPGAMPGQAAADFVADGPPRAGDWEPRSPGDCDAALDGFALAVYAGEVTVPLEFADGINSEDELGAAFDRLGEADVGDFAGITHLHDALADAADNGDGDDRAADAVEVLIDAAEDGDYDRGELETELRDTLGDTTYDDVIGDDLDGLVDDLAQTADEPGLLDRIDELIDGDDTDEQYEPADWDDVAAACDPPDPSLPPDTRWAATVVDAFDARDPTGSLRAATDEIDGLLAYFGDAGGNTVRPTWGHNASIDRLSVDQLDINERPWRPYTSQRFVDEVVDAALAIIGQDNLVDATGKVTADTLVQAGVPQAAATVYATVHETQDAFIDDHAVGGISGCRAPLELIAAVGGQESNHGRHDGSGVDPETGDVRPKIVGDANHTGELAQGPMQFLPSSWDIYGVDFDERKPGGDPHNYYDAVAAAVVHLCDSGGGSLETEEEQAQALAGYYGADVDGYVASVLSTAQGFASMADTQAGVAGGGDLGDALQWAKGEIGVPYSMCLDGTCGPGGRFGYDLGANDPHYDCSGFITRVAAKAGIALPCDALHTGGMISSPELAEVEVPLEQREAGDILVYNPGDGRIGHAGIYLGDGRVIQSSGGLGVNIVDFHGSWFARQGDRLRAFRMRELTNTPDVEHYPFGECLPEVPA